MPPTPSTSQLINNLKSLARKEGHFLMLETSGVFSNIQPHLSTHPIASVDFPRVGLEPSTI